MTGNGSPKLTPPPCGQPGSIQATSELRSQCTTDYVEIEEVLDVRWTLHCFLHRPRPLLPSFAIILKVHYLNARAKNNAPVHSGWQRVKWSTIHDKSDLVGPKRVRNRTWHRRVKAQRTIPLHPIHRYGNDRCARNGLRRPLTYSQSTLVTCAVDRTLEGTTWVASSTGFLVLAQYAVCSGGYDLGGWHSQENCSPKSRKNAELPWRLKMMGWSLLEDLALFSGFGNEWWKAF